VVGATGLQGGAVTRRLTRGRVAGRGSDPQSRRLSSPRARCAGRRGGQGRLENKAALERSFAGAHGVYSVQNHHISGYDGEIRQGKNVADAVVAANVSHLVYASTGNGLAGTGIGSWDAKVAVAEHARSLGAPLTVLRPTAFMELMTEKRFYPQASVWHVTPKVMGETRPIGWLTVDDLAVIAEKAFADPATFVGTDVSLAGDILSIQQCRTIWQEVKGRPPRRATGGLRAGAAPPRPSRRPR